MVRARDPGLAPAAPVRRRRWRGPKAAPPKVPPGRTTGRPRHADGSILRRLAYMDMAQSDAQATRHCSAGKQPSPGRETLTGPGNRRAVAAARLSSRRVCACDCARVARGPADQAGEGGGCSPYKSAMSIYLYC